MNLFYCQILKFIQGNNPLQTGQNPWYEYIKDAEPENQVLSGFKICDIEKYNQVSLKIMWINFETYVFKNLYFLVEIILVKN